MLMVNTPLAALMSLNSSASESLVGANRDVITDSIVGSDNALIFINTRACSSVAGQLRFNTATTILQGDIDGNGMADLEIQLNGVAASNFIL